MKNKLSLWLLSAALMLPAGSFAQVIGSWQDNDGDGWIDWGNALSITNAANTGKYSFVGGAVSNYTQSLQISQGGYSQNLAIKLQDLPGGVAAFLTNHLLSFTFSVPSAASSGSTAGFSQLYALAVNAQGYGFVDQSFVNLTTSGATNDNQGNQPNFYFYPGAAARSQVVTLNYSNILSAITATPSSGYIELIFTFNNGGGAATNYFINNVVLSGATTPPPPPPPSSTNVVIGSWQDNDGDGWIDWGNALSITNAANAGKYSFVSGAVSNYTQSLRISQGGYSQNLAIKLQDLPGGVAAFLTNQQLSFTFSVPSAASSGSTAGYSQLYALAVNAQGYGFVDQSFANLTTSGATNDNQGNQPNFYFYPGAAARSQVVTLNYSNILSAITATPSSGYIELIFTFNNGGGAATNYFINNVVLSGATTPPPPPPPSSTNVVIGGWQDNDGDGWIDWGNALSITNAANTGKYSFVGGAVSNYTQSLQISQAGFNQNLAIKLQDVSGGVAAFLTNKQMSFTFSVPSAASSGSTAGYSQLYAVAINATGYGFNDQATNRFTTTGDTNDNLGWRPNFNFYTGAPARSQVVTLNYSNILSAITATPSSGYIEIIFSFNNGGGAPTNYFINNVVLAGSSGSVTNPPAGPLAFTFTLLNGPTNSSLNSSNGVFTWRPLVSQANTTNLVVVKVTDNSAPPQSATNSYTVAVNPLIPATISSFSVSGGQPILTVDGTQGPDYTVLSSTNLVDWQPLFTTNSPVVPVNLMLPVTATNRAGFFRIGMGP